jgi:amino acid adenylation domain-containing protein
MILAEMAAVPNNRVSELQLLDASDKSRLITDWNRTSTPYPHDRTVSDLFETRASASPAAIALDFDGQALSYGELNERANQLARYLQTRGAGPGVMVGLYLERGVEMIIAMLGILKAGGVYVPLDLDYPKPRLAYMLEDAQVPVLLTTSTLQPGLPAFEGEVIRMDTDWPTITQQGVANLGTQADAGAAAYVIYTSGSTGQPKGVVVPHRAINRLVCATNYFQVRASDRVAQASNVSFDAATFEIWGALLNGAKLVGVNKDILLSPRDLSAFLAREKISAMFITTALFNLMAREAPGAFSGLRGLMFGGEAVDVDAVRRVLATSPPKQLLHVYGPTESTTFASWYAVSAVADDAVTVPIGRPVANTTLYVLDRHRNPVPVGVPGELYIGGDGLALGYLDQPALTAEKFVEDPFSDVPGARLYRTGDRVRYRENGDIEFMGRFDHQVKVRGFRIELGEIETLLMQQNDIEAATVVLREDVPGDRRIVAYVVAAQDQSISTDELRDRLQARLRDSLPAYMVPSALVVLDDLPLTPNGKIDRDALPRPTGRPQRDTSSNKPETKMEIIMAEIWEELLDIDDIEVDDMFFDLGGHSLSAVNAIERFEQRTGIRLEPVSMINQTLRQLVTGLELRQDQQAESPGKSLLGRLKKKLLKRR